MESQQSSNIAYPGLKIGSTDSFEAGEGTYVKEKTIFAAIAGYFKTADSSQQASSDDPKNKSSKPILYIETVNAKPTVVPKEKSVVLAQVTKITPRFASVAILSVDDVSLSEYFPGTIRLGDVRLAQADQVEIYKCFRPGDIVRAEVISLGDSRAYYLSTAKNEYGVIMAKSIAGHIMVPVSWNLMQCPKTKMKEFRKVAKSTTTES